MRKACPGRYGSWLLCYEGRRVRPHSNSYPETHVNSCLHIHKKHPHTHVRKISNYSFQHVATAWNAASRLVYIHRVSASYRSINIKRSISGSQYHAQLCIEETSAPKLPVLKMMSNFAKGRGHWRREDPNPGLIYALSRQVVWNN